MSRVKEILKGMEKVPLDQMRAELSGGGRSSEFEVFKKLALEKLEPGGEPFRREELTESEVSSIRTQVNHLNDDDAEEKEYVVRRKKMRRDDGSDYVVERDGEEKQLYKIFIRQRDLSDIDLTEDGDEDESADRSEAERTNGESKTEQEEKKAEAEADFEELFDEG